MIQSLHESSTMEPIAIAVDRPAVSIDEVLEAARLRSRTKSPGTSNPPLKFSRPREHWLIQLMWIAIAAAIVWMTFYAIKSYWSPAHPGVDQNGYQVGGKLFAETFSTGFKPVNPYTYVGWMWVQTPDGWMYPKYPLGLPLLDAIGFWLTPTFHQGVVWAYLVSPICTVLASAAMFLMVRMLASSFAAICAMILLAANPVALILANNSNSHAPDLCFVMWGMLFLMWWAKYGGWWRGIIAGFLLGYALTIRYTEGLLILPMLAAAAMAMPYRRGRQVQWWATITWAILLGWLGMLHFAKAFPKHPSSTWWISAAAFVAISGISVLRTRRSISLPQLIGMVARALVCAVMFCALMHVDLAARTWKNPIDKSIVAWSIIVSVVGMLPLIYAIDWSEPRKYARHAIVVFGWLIPVVALAAYNKAAMGSWTGYDTTNESDGFSFTYFIDKWEFMSGELHSVALFLIAPLGLAGIALMFKWNWRAALILTLWFLPGLLLYTAYYWGLNTPGVAYLRFFLTLLPPLIVGAAWLLDHAALGIGDVGRIGTRIDGSRRGAVVAPIAAGIVVAAAAGMNLYTIRGPLERDFAIQANLANVADHVTAKATPAFETDPAQRPIFFSGQWQLLNYMQFAANYECYAVEAFSPRHGQHVPDPNAPSPLQEARAQAMHELYKYKTDADLVNEAHKIINSALSSDRPVYVALPWSAMPAFRARFITHDLDAKELDSWREPVQMTDAGRKALMALGPAGGFFAGNAAPQNWELLQIVRKTGNSTSSSGMNRPSNKSKAFFQIK